jgi:hypothetical protein
VAIVNPPGWATGRCAGPQGNKEGLGYLSGVGWRAAWLPDVRLHTITKQKPNVKISFNLNMFYGNRIYLQFV